MIVTNFYSFKQLKQLFPQIVFVNVRIFVITNSTWILIVTIQRIEQNQMQDMKKTKFSCHKITYFTMQT